MRRVFLLGLGALVLGVGLIALIQTEPGYVLVTYGDYTVETSLWVALALIVLVVLLLYGLVHLIHRLLLGPRSLSSWLGHRRARQASRQTASGVINFIEGKWAKSRTQLVKGAEGNEDALLNYLLAARASQRLGDPERATRHLAEAEALSAGSDVAVALTRAELALDAGDYQRAAEALEQARSEGGRHPRVVELLCRTYAGAERWHDLIPLLPEARKQRVLPFDELLEMERAAHARLLQRIAEAEGEGAAEALQEQWHQVPPELRRDPAMLQGYASLLVAEGADQAAGDVILRGLRDQWDPALVRLFGYVRSADPARQLETAEAWLAQHADDAQLLLCLGRLSARCELWGKARDYFEKSYQLENTPEVCAELGRLLASQGEELPAAAYYREGLAQEEARLPELPLPPRLLPGSQRLQQSS